MSRGTPTDRFVDEFVPANSPPAAADGGPELEPAPTGPLPIAPISLCTMGPCANYHELRTELDAQQPTDGSKIRLPLFTSRGCYPSDGIEIELTGDANVYDCNRWTPLSGNAINERLEKRNAFWRREPTLKAQFEASWHGHNTQQGDDDDASA